MFVRQHLHMLPTREDRADLAAITALVEDSMPTPVLDRSYPLAEVAEGLREAGHAHGKVVITFAQSTLP